MAGKVEFGMGFSQFKRLLFQLLDRLLSRRDMQRQIGAPVRSDWQAAQDLINAIDQGGIPLNPLRVNAIARNLGMEVSRHAAVEDTIARIRAVLQRTPATQPPDARG